MHKIFFWSILSALVIPVPLHAQPPQAQGTAPMTQLAKGTFEVTIKPLSVEGTGDDKNMGRMSIDKTISGDLIATARGQMLTAMTDTQGSAGYVAIERVTGSLNGYEGSFLLQHSATMNRGEPSMHISVVPDSGTGALKGLVGDFKIQIVDGAHLYEFSYGLDP